MQWRSDSGLEGLRTGGMHREGIKDLSDTGKEGLG